MRWCGGLGEGEDLLHETGFLGSPDGYGGPEEAVISDVRTFVWSVLCLSKSFCRRDNVDLCQRMEEGKHWIFFCSYMYQINVH